MFKSFIRLCEGIYFWVVELWYFCYKYNVIDYSVFDVFYYVICDDEKFYNCELESGIFYVMFCVYDCIRCCFIYW